MNVKEELITAELLDRGYSSANNEYFSKVFRNYQNQEIMFVIALDTFAEQLYLDHSSIGNLESSIAFDWSGDFDTLEALEDFAYSL